MSGQREMLSRLGSRLREEAVDLTPYGVFEFCFPVRIARAVLSDLVSSGLVPLGGDLWRRDPKSGFEPGHENWFLNRKDASGRDVPIEQVVAKAEAFIGRFENDSHCYVTFVV